jgi:large subunit ribosomal protein L4
MKAPLYTQSGDQKGEITLAKNIFEVEGGEGLVHSYLLYQQKNARMPIAHTLTKGLVRGGGKKPFAQKHTGRARQGSIKNPHMRGGGVVFGPKKWQNFEIMMPKKMRRKALFQILSTKAKDGKILALDKFELDAPKTKTFAQLIEKLPVKRDVLVVGSREEKTLKTSSRNFARSKTILSNYLNPADLLKYDTVLFTETALKDLEATYK